MLSSRPRRRGERKPLRNFLRGAAGSNGSKLILIPTAASYFAVNASASSNATSKGGHSLLSGSGERAGGRGALDTHPYVVEKISDSNLRRGLRGTLVRSRRPAWLLRSNQQEPPRRLPIPAHGWRVSARAVCRLRPAATLKVAGDCFAARIASVSR